MVRHEGDEYLTVEEAAVMLGKSRRTVERYAEDKKIKRYKRGFRIMFKRSDLERFLNEPEEIVPEEE